MFRIKYSREIVLKILYQLDALKCDAAQSGPVIEEYFKSFRSVNPEEEKFIRRMVQTVMDQRAEIDDTISKNLIGWKLNRLALIDRNLLRMGIAEATFNSEKPIIIDDLLRIAKKYSDADSYKLINAILDKVIPLRLLLLLLYVWTPLRQETSFEVFVTCRTPEIFSDYHNYNFRQEIRPGSDGLNVKILSRTLSLQNLNHVVRADARYLAGQGPAVKRAFGQVRLQALSVADYLKNISLFLKNQIEYTEAELPQGAEAVLAQRQAHCIGFANVAQALLACVGIASRPVNGFYLREAGGQVEPVPHRWLEIDLPGGRRVFYDPQYQDFSSRYLVTNLGFPLERIERFAGVVVRKNKKILDE